MVNTKLTKLTNLPELPNFPNKKSQTFNEIDLTTCTTQFLVRRAPSATLGEKGDDG